MFSRASSRKSSGVVLGVHRHLSSRTLSNKSQPSSSSSSSQLSQGSHNENNYKGSSRRSSIFDLILRSVSSGVLVSSIGYSIWSSNISPNPSVCFADAKEEQIWRFDDPDALGTSIFPNTFRKRKFFIYEQRLREKSTSEKVFQYFSSEKNDDTGELFMTPDDLMRAVVPVFPPYDSYRVRAGSLKGEKVPGDKKSVSSKFFLLFDTDGDGLISFAEYMFFVTLLSIPESSFGVAFKMFDLNNSGDIDREEFNRVMALMRNLHTKSKDGHRIKVRVEKGGLLEYFFGKDGKKGLKHERFVQFFRDLHEEILRLEFDHYDEKNQGTISAKDFGLSLVASADLNDINKLLDRVDEINNEPELNNIRITYKEFKDFADLRKHLQSFSLAIFSYGEANGVLKKSDFQRAASKVCGITLTNNVIDLIYHVFDTNGDGDLSANEFLKALKNRGGDSSADTGIGGLLTCWLNCAQKAGCSFF